jgi:hypothetical protein
MNKDGRHRPQSYHDDLMGDASVINGAQPAADPLPGQIVCTHLVAAPYLRFRMPHSDLIRSGFLHAVQTSRCRFKKVE